MKAWRLCAFIRVEMGRAQQNLRRQTWTAGINGRPSRCDPARQRLGAGSACSAVAPKEPTQWMKAWRLCAFIRVEMGRAQQNPQRQTWTAGIYGRPSRCDPARQRLGAGSACWTAGINGCPSRCDPARQQLDADSACSAAAPKEPTQRMKAWRLCAFIRVEMGRAQHNPRRQTWTAGINGRPSRCDQTRQQLGERTSFPPM